MDIGDDGEIYIWISGMKEEYIFGNISSLLSIKHGSVPIQSFFSFLLVLPPTKSSTTGDGPSTDLSPI